MLAQKLVELGVVPEEDWHYCPRRYPLTATWDRSIGGWVGLAALPACLGVETEVVRFAAHGAVRNDQGTTVLEMRQWKERIVTGSVADAGKLR